MHILFDVFKDRQVQVVSIIEQDSIHLSSRHEDKRYNYYWRLLTLIYKKIHLYKKCNHHAINYPTQFSEHSSSRVDIIFLSNKDLVLSRVGAIFLNEEILYHCPIKSVFIFSKPKLNSYAQHIWIYNETTMNF